MDASTKLTTDLENKVTGISPRDFFAGMALLSILKTEGHHGGMFESDATQRYRIATMAFRVADSMMAARGKNK